MTSDCPRAAEPKRTRLRANRLAAARTKPSPVAPHSAYRRTKAKSPICAHPGKRRATRPTPARPRRRPRNRRPCAPAFRRRTRSRRPSRGSRTWSSGKATATSRPRLRRPAPACGVSMPRRSDYPPRTGSAPVPATQPQPRTRQPAWRRMPAKTRPALHRGREHYPRPPLPRGTAVRPDAKPGPERSPKAGVSRRDPATAARSAAGDESCSRCRARSARVPNRTHNRRFANRRRAGLSAHGRNRRRNSGRKRGSLPTEKTPESKDVAA